MHVKVLVRVRPLLPHELAQGHTSTMLALEPHRGGVTQDLHSGGRTSFSVDHVVSHASSQHDVFHLGGLPTLVDAVVDGYNATVFAYGQTGSGKTFTMEGYEYAKAAASRAPQPSFDTPSERLGLTPRSVAALFAAVERRNAAAAPGEPRLRVMCHFVQIYKEAVLDLLNPAAAPAGGGVGGLKIRWSAEREFFVDNLFTEEVATAEQALGLFQRGVGNKRVAETRMNAASSRSHCIFTLAVQQMDPARPEHVQAEGKLTLVDLAGSERQQALLDSANRSAMADSVQINKSLFTLRKVILALSEASSKPSKHRAHVPYRDGTLTRLLKQALGGNCHTLMVACISPCDAHAEENASTLAYAARARAISNAPVLNVDPHAAQVAELKAEIRSLKAELARLQQLLSLSGGEHPLPSPEGMAALPPPAMSSAASPPPPCAHALVASSPQRTDGAVAASLAAPAKDKASGALEHGLLQGVQLAKQLAKSNAQLRTAFDALAEQRDELDKANGLLTAENMALQEKLSFFELAVAMESYPSAPPASVAAQIEQQLRKAALELIELRSENASIKDQLAAHNLAVASSECEPSRPKDRSSRGGAKGAKPRASGGSKGYGSAAFGDAAFGGAKGSGKGAGEAAQPAPMPRLSLSTTGELLLGHAWAPPPPATGQAVRPSDTRTVARLMPTTSTFEELDQLSALLRKRAELTSVSRPSTAAPIRGPH
ncbi:hypothetical protein AB1Y20_010303 [Prymnesium parvum]|uniref:Kinesin-like protein n=1 Tax=Prymnesium parvum TaxID=97485 RepID=A0AB34K6F1_PRYPA